MKPITGMAYTGTSVRDRRSAGRRKRKGMTALEVVLIIGALLPIMVFLLRMLIIGLRLYHEHIGYTVGSPLM